MSTLRQKMLEDLQLAGLAASTQAAYVRAVRGLAAHFRTAPDQLTEKQVRDYFLFLKNSKKYSPNTLRGIYAAIKFFYARTVPRKWRTLDQLKVPRQKTLPDVLTVKEVRQLIARVRRHAIRTYMWTVYSCGLRLSEGLHLRIGDLDSQRMMVHVRRGKGAKDRYVPLPSATLDMLREFWITHRHPQWLFPAQDRKGRATPAGPILHLTNVGEEQARATINKLMQE